MPLVDSLSPLRGLKHYAMNSERCKSEGVKVTSHMRIHFVVPPSCLRFPFRAHFASKVEARFIQNEVK